MPLAQEGEAGGSVTDRAAPCSSHRLTRGPTSPCIGDVVGPVWRTSWSGSGSGDGEVVGGGPLRWRVLLRSGRVVANTEGESCLISYALGSRE
jgi:hypothetical protein